MHLNPLWVFLTKKGCFHPTQKIQNLVSDWTLRAAFSQTLLLYSEVEALGADALRCILNQTYTESPSSMSSNIEVSPLWDSRFNAVRNYSHMFSRGSMIIIIIKNLKVKAYLSQWYWYLMLQKKSLLIYIDFQIPWTLRSLGTWDPYLVLLLTLTRNLGEEHSSPKTSRS